jgi:hypothetical protein
MTEQIVVKIPRMKTTMRPSFFSSLTLRRSRIGIGRMVTMTSEMMVTTA